MGRYNAFVLEMNKLLLTLIKKIEALQNGIIAYAYKDTNWWVVAVDDYNFYKDNKQFRLLAEQWRKVFKSKNVKIVYAFRAPNEKILENLLEHNSLIMNI